MRSLAQSLPAGDRILIDSTVLIAYLNGGESVSPLAQHLVDDLVRGGRNPAVVSMVSVMEVLVLPRRRGVEPYHHALDFLTRFPNLHPQPIDIAVAQEAASTRAAFKLGTADALIVATGLVAQVSHLVTNDLSWRSRMNTIAKRLVVCLLSDHLT